jgi:hypothetical protein
MDVRCGRKWRPQSALMRDEIDKDQGFKYQFVGEMVDFSRCAPPPDCFPGWRAPR